MKNYLFVSLFFFIISCASSNRVYWCGDHPCINKKEKEAYFKKTMIVEVKDLKRDSHKDKSDVEKLLLQAKKSEKRRIDKEKDLEKVAKLEEKRRINKEKQLIKQAKLEEKRRIKEEKALLKETKLEEKRRIKEEKVLLKETKLEEKRRIKEEKALLKEIKLEENKRNKVEKKTLIKKVEKKQNKITKKNIVLESSIENAEISSSKFSELLEKIIKKNSFRAYPDINDIPN